jgi:pimeloyl-ACP methyl ester carboxylesterase
MKKLSKKTIILIITVVLITIATILYFAAPPYLYNKAIEGQRVAANLTIKSVNIPGVSIVYAEGGTGDTIIMLHGLGANKNFWLNFAKYLTPNYRVIIPDLPNFGDSSKSLDINMNVIPQVEKLNLFVKELKLTRFHLVGNSYGGNIAGHYAATYPEVIKTLALFDSGGVICPQKSELDLLLEKGTNPFMVKDVNDFNKLLELSYLKQPQMPSFIKKYLTKQAVKAKLAYENYESKWKGKGLFDDLFILESKLEKITAPTLIVWGDSDKMIDISCVPIFEKNIKNSKSVIIKECGHVPMMEKPEETATIYQDFLKEKK